MYPTMTLYPPRRINLKRWVPAVIGLLVAAIYLWLLTSSPLVQRTTPVGETGPASKALAQEEFLANCLEHGAATSFCGCMADGLQSHLSNAEFARLTTKQPEASLQPAIHNAVAEITEGCTLPLQLTKR